MTRFVIPIILIGISIVAFFMFTNPVYNNITLLWAEAASYDEALNNSKALENERDKLTAKYNSINPDNLTKLQKLLPENIDNIRLILEIEQLALPYGMILKDIKYSTTNTVSSQGGIMPEETAQLSNKDYGVWDLEFSTAGAYNNFINFTRDLESNLRIVDVSSIEFLSSTSVLSGSSPDSYKYNFKVKTYWLKN